MTEAAGSEIVRRWREVLTCYSRVSCALDRALQDAHGIGMSEFEALERLAETADDKIKMNRLGADMYLSQSALSRTVARLERAGLVERDMCPQDRRAVFVSLTDTGRELYTRARTTQRAVLAEHMVDDRGASPDGQDSGACDSGREDEADSRTSGGLSRR
ncbi:DNA-binding transcriptional regulator, MarR family [Thermomonospora echinospora]|uniref:DNA-binding transcriptional regulator, MarR family n=1 Tax=Thermomonospora echinospora TaxID=1992 RepID=A0A1H5THD2_9ACTN|nr:MarR family transcriptional regulator [Thermomonospora echinospora]SEF62174.1 DNA-binding transcriptional regulator, MarR family [Thermomonospora echinospora]